MQFYEDNKSRRIRKRLKFLSISSILYHFKIPKDHPLFIKVFADHKELLNDLDWIYFWANDISGVEKIDDWKENQLGFVLYLNITLKNLEVGTLKLPLLHIPSNVF